jgi:3-hydroxyisobutyrate dehydrogenase-like beta-hydroxyacid dehydrogenase
MTTIGFIGLGNLGLPIASNLAKAGYPLRVYNRTLEKTAPLAGLGAQVAATAAETTEKGGIVISLVSDDAALNEIATDALASSLGEGGIHLSMSTVGAHTSRALALHHRKFGVHYIAAPVFARPEAAAAKSGTVCLSGASIAERNGVHAMLRDAVAKQIFDFGDYAGSANVVKLIGNFMIATSVELLAEAFTLAEKNGIAASAVYDMFTSTLFAAPVFQNYGRIILHKNYAPPSFRLALGLKDVNLVLQNGNQTQTAIPIANLLHDRMVKGMANGHQDQDWSSFAEEARRDAGLR